MRFLFLIFVACSMFISTTTKAQEATPPIAPKAEPTLEESWPHQTTIERPDRNGKPQKPSTAYF